MTVTKKTYDRSVSLFGLGLSLLLLLFVGSCYPTFEHPIPPPSEVRADPHVLGTWVRTTQDGSKEQLSIFQRSSGWIDVVWIYGIDSEVSDDGITVLIFEGYTTSVKEQRFLCLRPREKDHDLGDEKATQRPFAIANYRTSGPDELTVRLFSVQKIERLIEEGKLKGNVVKDDSLAGRVAGETLEGQSLDSVVVTSSSDELVALISKEGVGAFIGNGEYDTLVFSRGTVHAGQ